MTWLLDTHTFLWFCQGDPSLSANAKALIEDSANRKLVSVADHASSMLLAANGKASTSAHT